MLTAARNCLGDFILSEEIGRGGMGIVYRAFDKNLGREVAVKILPLGAGGSETAKQRFLLEAKAAAQLNHEHIVPVYAIGEDS